MLAQRSAAPLAVLALFSAPLAAQLTTRISVRPDGTQVDGHSATAATSADGRYVAFISAAADVVPGDTNGVVDVFVRDLWLGTTERVSVSSDGAQADADCLGPNFGADGRYVTFRSDASTLVPGDGNGVSDVFVRDRWTGTTTRASVDAGGGDANAWSYYSMLSADGGVISFQSEASDLVANDTNGAFDVFVRDLATGVTELVSVGSGGQPSGFFEFSVEPTLSGDGRVVAFSSLSGFDPLDQNATLDVYVRDRVAGTTTLASAALSGQAGDGPSGLPSLSADGRYVAFVSEATDLVSDDTNGVADVFVRDLVLGVTERVSVSSSGAQANDTCYLYYSHPTISADGSRVVFESYASNLVSGDGNGWSDVFVRDRVQGRTRIVSVRPDGGGVHLGASRGTISADGERVAFESAGPLVPGDTNDGADVFLHLLRFPCDPVESYCSARAYSTGCVAAISSTGVPRVAGPESFAITASGVRSHTAGFLVWGPAEAALPFGGGTLCVAPPFARTWPRSSGGAPGVDDCSGAWSVAFTGAVAAPGPLAPGTTLYAQFLSRDPGYPAPDDWVPSDALRFTPCP